MCLFFFSSRRRHTRLQGDWSSDVCSSDLRKWDRLLSALARRVNPLPGPRRRGGLDLHGYYWSMRESEYATDVMFKDAAALAGSEKGRVGEEGRSPWAPDH